MEDRFPNGSPCAARPHGLVSMHAPTARPALWMIAGAFAFATMSALTYALGPRCDWLVIALIRAVCMFSISAGIARWSRVRLHLWTPPTLWLRSVSGSVSLVCNFYAMTRLPVADVLTLTNTYPLWIMLLSAIALRLPPTAGETAGVLCGLAGVVLVQQPHLGGDRLAALVALAASVSTAVAMLGLHRLRGVAAPAIVAHFAGVASVIAAVWLALRSGSDILWPHGAETWAMIAGVAISGTAGQFCLTRAYAAAPPSEIAVVGLSQVVFAIAFDVLLWGRRLSPPTLAGIALVLAPCAWLTGRATRRLAETAREGAVAPAARAGLDEA
jgi:drug/metabolite transporter (DMT)-like permease